MHFVYILYSPAINRFYIGETANPDERLRHHRSGDQRYTRRATDWVQVFLTAVNNRTEALAMEKHIKKSKNRKSLLRWIRGQDNQVAPAVWEHMDG